MLEQFKSLETDYSQFINQLHRAHAFFSFGQTRESSVSMKLIETLLGEIEQAHLQLQASIKLLESTDSVSNTRETLDNFSGMYEVTTEFFADLLTEVPAPEELEQLQREELQLSVSTADEVEVTDTMSILTI